MRKIKLNLLASLLLSLAPNLLSEELLKLDVNSAWVDGKNHDAIFELSADRIKEIPSYDWRKDDFPPLSLKSAIERAYEEYYSDIGLSRSEVFDWVSIDITSGRPDRKAKITAANEGRRFHWYTVRLYPYNTDKYIQVLPLVVLFDGEVLLPRLKKL